MQARDDAVSELLGRPVLEEPPDALCSPCPPIAVEPPPPAPPPQGLSHLPGVTDADLRRARRETRRGVLTDAHPLMKGFRVAGGTDELLRARSSLSGNMDSMSAESLDSVLSSSSSEEQDGDDAEEDAAAALPGLAHARVGNGNATGRAMREAHGGGPPEEEAAPLAAGRRGVLRAEGAVAVRVHQPSVPRVSTTHSPGLLPALHMVIALLTSDACQPAAPLVEELAAFLGSVSLVQQAEATDIPTAGNIIFIQG